MPQLEYRERYRSVCLFADHLLPVTLTFTALQSRYVRCTWRWRVHHDRIARRRPAAMSLLPKHGADLADRKCARRQCAVPRMWVAIQCRASLARRNAGRLVDSSKCLIRTFSPAPRRAIECIDHFEAAERVRA
jgi:hypothetical protein